MDFMMFNDQIVNNELARMAGETEECDVKLELSLYMQ